MIVGEVQYRNALPWWLVVIHVSLAATIWTLTVAIAYCAAAASRAPLVTPRRPPPQRLSSVDGERPPDRRAADAAPPGPDRGVPRLERRRPGGDARGRDARRASGTRSRFADIDPEGFVDFQATRPTVSLDDGLTRRIDWPETSFHAAAIPGADRDAVILLGVEPNYRWRAFNDLVVDLARDLGVELVVTLGALLADVPHTRPAPVTGAASDLSLVEELGLQRVALRGPDGHRRRPRTTPAARRGSRRSASGRRCRTTSRSRRAPARRARSATASASSSASTIDVHELEEAEEVYAEQITEAVASDPETAAYVEELERRADTIDEMMDDGRRRSADRRVARRRADALPARPRARTTTRRRPGSRARGVRLSRAPAGSRRSAGGRSTPAFSAALGGAARSRRHGLDGAVGAASAAAAGGSDRRLRPSAALPRPAPLLAPPP